MKRQWTAKEKTANMNRMITILSSKELFDYRPEGWCTEDEAILLTVRNSQISARSAKDYLNELAMRGKLESRYESGLLQYRYVKPDSSKDAESIADLFEKMKLAKTGYTDKSKIEFVKVEAT